MQVYPRLVNILIARIPLPKDGFRRLVVNIIPVIICAGVPRPSPPVHAFKPSLIVKTFQSRLIAVGLFLQIRDGGNAVIPWLDICAVAADIADFGKNNIFIIICRNAAHDFYIWFPCIFQVFHGGSITARQPEISAYSNKVNGVPPIDAKERGMICIISQPTGEFASGKADRVAPDPLPCVPWPAIPCR